MTIDDLLKQLEIGEDQDVEFKSAEGGLPKSVWETISAFSNTEGGFIILGVTHKGEMLEITGIRKPEAMVKAFWDAHNSPEKLKPPICKASDVLIIAVSGHRIIVINVPRALRQQRPVFINGNPITGTFKRNFEGDYRCTEAEVRQMLRDASDEPQDSQIIEHFDLSDLDAQSLSAYRNRFASRDPGHPFLALNDSDFLERLGGLRRDRKTGEEGMTLAGLLMFGRERSLLDALPHYHLDYQEQLAADPEKRWTYRITIDGTWEPNLFNFYHRVYPRLTTDIEVPFHLDGEAVRKGETHIHEALREALVNTLIHADHLSTRPIVVIKRADVYVFQNPGRLRIPIHSLYTGGISDPRNPNLQKMFQLLGLGEKAGSGFQKILRAWREQEWIMPLVSEKHDIDLTAISLPMISLIPEKVEKELRTIVGDAYSSLAEVDRIALVLAHRFGEVSNTDIKQYRHEHPRDIGERLKSLVEHEWLTKSGQGRGTRYKLGGSKTPDLFSPRSEHLEASSEHLPERSEHLAVTSEHYQELLKIAGVVREKGKAGKDIVKQVILQLCANDYLSLRTLSGLLNRAPDSIRNHYLSPMLAAGLLKLRHPEQPNHPQQGYKTVSASS